MRVRCPQCGNRSTASPESVGKKARCPKPNCRHVFVIAAVDEADVDGAESDFALPSKKGKRSKKASKKKKPSLLTRQPLWIVGITVAGLLIAAGVVSFFRSGSGTDGLGVTATAEAAEAKVLPAGAQVDFSSDVQPFLKKYCYECHGPDYQEGGVEFHRYPTSEDVVADRKMWSKAFDLVKVGAMPPSEMDQPSDAERDKFVSWLDYTLFYVDCDLPRDPGRVTVHRLNRTEYNNTVHDLLAVDVTPADKFPSDDVGYGFDNIGDVLSVPPLLVEKYLDAAEEVAAAAIVTKHPNYLHEEFDGLELKTEGAARADRRGLAIISRGTGYAEIPFQGTGTYRVKLNASANQAGDEPAKLEFKVGDKVLHTFVLEGDRDKRDYEFEFRPEAGKKKVQFTFINDFYDENAADKNRRDRNAYIHRVDIEGPLDIPENISDVQRQLTQTRPSETVSVREAAHQNLKEFLPKAFRRPVTPAEVESYARFAEMAVEQGETFEFGMTVALQAILVSPQFLFRVEDRTVVPGKVEVPVNDFALASRLSYFLWSSMPDDELFELAKQNRLHEPDVLEAQTRRMLKDERADALIENFAGQWLGLRKLATNEVAPDPEVYPEFNDMVRYDFWKETELFFRDILRENRSIYDMVDARYTFVNDRLAKIYGIEGVEGPEFRRVVLTDGHRAGLLTQGSILTLTSYPTRTSPVKRGQWVLENLLGTPPPAAPPVVPALEETQKANPNLSFREQLELHRKDPTCASCHKLMDDIGFGLQNFDAIGRWRERDGEFPIDATGTLPTGESFEGPIELIEILRNRKEQFGRCLSEKLLTYAIGRGVEYYDKCAIDEILAELERDDRFETLVVAIVKSRPFLMRRGQPEQEQIAQKDPS
ncbi:MAG: DUF1592 domain-containing protein [Planctomycetaceae bacterium]|nr:DUF1592 domain-containing protein [Planctomycetaceae bacterium]